MHEIYTVDELGDYLEHHGILGQRWGQLNGPPYPLSNSGHSSKEKSSADKAGVTVGKSSGKGSIKNLKRTGLSSTQKKILIGAGITVASVLAVYGGYKLYKVYGASNNNKVVNDFINGISKTKVSDISGFENKKKVVIPNDSKALQSFAKNINLSHSRTNCGSCSTTVIQNLVEGSNKYESLSEVPEHMRFVRNDGTLSKGYDPNKLIQCFKNGKWETPISGINRKELSNKVENKLKSFGNDSYGILYPDKLVGRNTGHYFAWCVSDNKVHVIEGQPSSEGIVWDHNFFEDVGKLFDPMAEVHIANLTDSPILPDRISDLMKLRYS